jgi:hypothetical protein
MDDQLDKSLKNRIKEVFDNYEDTTADEGWLKLRQVFPVAQKRRRGLLWLWMGAAAVLLLFLGVGIGLWLSNKPGQPEKLSDKKTKLIQPQNTAQAEKLQVDSINKQSPILATSLGGKLLAKAQNNNLTVKTDNKLLNHKAKADYTKKDKSYYATEEQAVQKANTKNSSSVSLQEDAQAVDDKPETNTQQLVKTGKPGNALTAQADTGKRKPIADKPNSKPVTKPSIASMFAADQGKAEQKNEVKYKKLSLEVYAASYFNYAHGSNNQLNAGAGFTANIALSDKLTLVTGVFVGQNTLSYGHTVPIAATASAYAVSTPAGITASNSSVSLLTASERPVASLNNYDASLVGLDVPLNLKFKFSPQTNDTYVLAGFSSGTFINESYTYKYNYNTTTSAFTQTNNKSFDNFYFAKTLNVAFGVGYPLGKNKLIIEPFLKYPLQGLGTQDIHFGSGGLNLKFNFEPSKK